METQPPCPSQQCLFPPHSHRGRHDTNRHQDTAARQRGAKAPTQGDRLRLGDLTQQPRSHSWWWTGDRRPVCEMAEAVSLTITCTATNTGPRPALSPRVLPVLMGAGRTRTQEEVDPRQGGYRQQTPRAPATATPHPRHTAELLHPENDHAGPTEHTCSPGRSPAGR